MGFAAGHIHDNLLCNTCSPVGGAGDAGADVGDDGDDGDEADGAADDEGPAGLEVAPVSVVVALWRASLVTMQLLQASWSPKLRETRVAAAGCRLC